MVKIVILAFYLIAITSTQLQVVSAQNTVGITNENNITIYKSYICNHTLWKAYMEPIIRSDRQLRRNDSDTKARQQFNTYVGITNQLDTTQYRLPLCNKQLFLECNEDNRCVCGTIVPHRYEEKELRCLATDGSTCLQDRDCINNNCRSKYYCGGEEAFMRESKSSALEKLSYKFILGAVIITKFVSTNNA